MKDAFGGAFMLRILIVFFVIFICFMTVAVNFARTFAVKNGVINILESNVGAPVKDISDAINKFLVKSHYAYETNGSIITDCNSKKVSSPPMKTLNGNIHGVCVVPHGDDEEFYYTVYAYIVIDFPLFRSNLVVPIKGESITIVQ